MEIGYRTFKVTRAEDDEYPKGILTTEQPVEMYDWQRADYIPEVLLMSGMKARGKTIKLLDTHKTDSVSNVLGSFSNLERKQAGDREVPYNFVEGRIEVSSVHPEIKTKLDEGHINEMSVGYKYTEDKTVYIPKGKSKEINGQKYDGPLNIRTEWHAEEASLVPLGADSQAQIRGYKNFKEAQQKISHQKGESKSKLTDVTIQKAKTNDTVGNEEKPKGEKTQTTTKTQQKNDMENIEKNDGVEEQVNAAVKATKDAFDKRADAILALGEEVGDSNWALTQLRSNKSVENVQREAIQKIKEDSKSLGSLSQPEPLGLNEKESKSYSITNAMKSLVNGGKVEGLEKEVSDAIAKRSGKETHGFFLASQRDLVAGTATAGAELVPTDTRGGDFIDALRPNMVTLQAGVRVLNGLKGDVSIPRKTDTSTASFKAEVATHTTSEPTFDSVTLTPRHLGCFTDVSKQLLAQGSPDVDALIRDDLNQAIAVGLDKAVIQGAGDGSNAPQGVIGQSSVPVMTIADDTNGAPTNAELHSYLKSLDDNNALSGNCSWITTPTVASTAKQTLLSTGVAGYQWNMDNNTMLGYPAYSTANIPAKRTIFGDFSEYILGIFDGIEIVYDPFSGAKTRTVTFVLNLMCDGDVRQPKAFATSDDGS